MDTIFQPELVARELDASSSQDVIKQLTELLAKQKRVKTSFLQAVLEREKQYPTGLPSAGVFVAIPHADSQHVDQSGVAIATLKKPVAFGMMGTPDKTLEVEVVLLLAIADSGVHLQLLTGLMSVFSNGSLLRKVKDAGTAEEIVELLHANVSVQMN